MVAPNLSYENVFRIIILKFMDAYDFDVRSVKKSCVHIVHSSSKLIVAIHHDALLYRQDLLFEE